MLNNYRNFKDIASDVKAELTALNVFKTVKAAAITDYSQLQKLSKTVAASRRPAAIVCIGPGSFDKEGLIREAGVAIVMIDDFNAEIEDKAFDLWDCLESVMSTFLPAFDNYDKPVFKEINTVRYFPADFRPVSMQDSRDSAYVFELETKEIYKYYNETGE